MIKVCSICRNGNLEKYWNGESILFCKGCGHGLTNKNYDYGVYELDGAIHRFGLVVEIFLRTLNYGRCLSVLAKVKKKRGSILDSGCGRGEVVSFFNKLGWRSIGTELNDRTATESRNKGLKIVISKEFPNFVSKNSGTFDLITAFHNLEHIDDVNLFISNCNSLLGENGRIFIEVPNFNSFQSNIAREAWILLDPKNHVHHFTKESLILLLNNNGLGFKFLNTWSFKFGPIGMLFAILSKNKKLIRILQFADLNHVKFNSLFPIRVLLIAFLLPICFFVEMFSTISGRGAVLKVIAYKLD